MEDQSLMPRGLLWQSKKTMGGIHPQASHLKLMRNCAETGVLAGVYAIAHVTTCWVFWSKTVSGRDERNTRK